MTKKILFATIATTMLLAIPALLQAGEITRANWGASVGFAVEPNPAGFSPGMTVSAANLAQVQNLVPPGIQLLMKKYNLTMQTQAYKPYAPANSYIKATSDNQGKAQVWDVGDKYRELGFKGYVAGLPFPNPQDGLQVAYNYLYAYLGDDATNEFGVYWISAKSGIERSEDWTWDYIARAMYRTDIAPLPHFPDAAAEKKQYFSMTTCQKPADKKGFTALYWRYTEPKDQDGYIYNPAQRRPIRFAFGTRGDAWNNTDLLYEDVRGYMGYAEWMNWKIVKKATLLAPMHSKIQLGRQFVNQTYDFDTPPHWNFKAKYEPRPMYVVEATPKFRQYPYSRMVFYVDAESFYIIYKEAYDKKGQLWKVFINAWNDSKDESRFPPDIGTSLTIDLQAEHASAMPWFSSKVNVGLKPAQFSLAQLRSKVK